MVAGLNGHTTSGACPGVRSDSDPDRPQDWYFRARGAALVALVVLGIPVTIAAQETPLRKAPAAGGKALVARLLAEGAEGRAEECSDCTSVHLVVGGDKEPAARVPGVAHSRSCFFRAEASTRN